MSRFQLSAPICHDSPWHRQPALLLSSFDHLQKGLIWMGMLPALSPRKQLVKLSSSPAEEESKKNRPPLGGCKRAELGCSQQTAPTCRRKWFPGDRCSQLRAFPTHRGAESQRRLCKPPLSIARCCTPVAFIILFSVVPILTPFHLFSFTPNRVLKICGSNLETGP